MVGLFESQTQFAWCSANSSEFIWKREVAKYNNLISARALGISQGFGKWCRCVCLYVNARVFAAGCQPA